MSLSTTRFTWAWAAADERRRRPRLGAAATRPRDHAPPDHDLDRGLDAGPPALVEEVEQPIRLALSIHAAARAKRSRLMPVNDRYPLADVLAECRRYVSASPPEGVRRVRDARRRELLLRGCMSARRAARARRVQGQPDPLQPHGPLRGLLGQAVAEFKAVLDHARIPATVRLTRGQDIEAACGQLAASPRSR